LPVSQLFRVELSHNCYNTVNEYKEPHT
jgi:hypothetical protein